MPAVARNSDGRIAPQRSQTCGAIELSPIAPYGLRLTALVVSADMPFAQGRFCEAEGLKNVIPLSTFRSSFADDYGVTILDSFLAGLTARAIVIIDENDTVIYMQLVCAVANEPDYENALAAVL